MRPDGEDSDFREWLRSIGGFIGVPLHMGGYLSINGSEVWLSGSKSSQVYSARWHQHVGLKQHLLARADGVSKEDVLIGIAHEFWKQGQSLTLRVVES